MAVQPTAVETSTISDAPGQNGDTPGRTDKEPIAQQKVKYKGIAHASRTIPSGRFRKIVKEIETVLLEISVDGSVTSNPLDLRPAIPTLNAWANHLRSALKELTK